MRDFIYKRLSGAINEGAFISASALPFSDEINNYCRNNHCGKYNTSWACPPVIHSRRMEVDILNKYNSAFVFNNVYLMDGDFDPDGMNNALDENNRLIYSLVDYLRENSKDFYILKAGCCNLCPKCSYPDNRCLKPEQMFPSIEAYGIDVLSLAKKLDMNYYNGEHTITYFNIVLYN